MTTTSTLARRLDHPVLKGHFSANALQAFARFLEEAPDEALFRINPLAFARDHGLPEREAIDLFVHASRLGIVELDWAVICPKCGAIMRHARALRSLEKLEHCALCDVPVEATLDDAIEASFTVHPEVRAIALHHPAPGADPQQVARLVFTPNRSVNPELTAYIMSMLRGMGLVEPRGASTSVLQVGPGQHKFLDGTHHEALELTVEGELAAEPQFLRVEVRPGGLVARRAVVQPGPVALEVANATDEPVVWFLEEREPVRPANLFRGGVTLTGLTGKRLLTSQAFRDLYRAETLPAGSSFAVRSLTFLFTDLKGSTELYDRVGDLQAYHLVNEHFRILGETVASYDGAMVKTIGDAIMATFPDTVRAVEAMVDMHRRLDDWNRQSGAEDLVLKIGLHEGACIAVDSNDRLDFFGQTVNLAARIQGLANAHETCFSATVQQAPGVAELLSAQGVAAMPERALLKGIRGEVQVYRARIA